MKTMSTDLEESTPQRRSVAILNGALPSLLNRTRYTKESPTFASSARPPLVRGSSKTWIWSLAEGDVPAAPLDGVVERTSLTTTLPVKTVLMRVSNYLRVKSVACTFSREDASVDCRTDHMLHFMINFFRAADSRLIVEVQRRKGCAIDMHCIRRGLFYTIQSGEEPAAKSLCGVDLVPRQICSLVKQLYSQYSSQKELTSEKLCQEGLDDSLELLDSSQEDQNVLGMEAVVAMMDKETTDPTVAETVAHSLMYEDGPNARGLRYELAFYLKRANRKEYHAYYMGVESFDDLHSLALQALSNALSVVVTLDCRPPLNTEDDFWQAASAGIQADITEAVESPQDAATAAKCLLLLLKLAPDALLLFSEDVLLPALIKAHSFGKAHHLGLEKQTEHLLGRLSHTTEITEVS